MTADDRSPSAGHPDLDTLADLHAGALDEPAAERLQRHVGGCPQCAASLEALDAVQGRLRALPAPPLPAEVAARLDATLADLGTTTGVAGNGTRPVPDTLPTRTTHTPPTSTTHTPPTSTTHTPPTSTTHTPPTSTTDTPVPAPDGDGRAGHDERAGRGRPAPDGDEPAGRGEPAARRSQRETDELELARRRRRRRLSRSLGAVAAAVAVIAAGASVTALVRTGGGSNDSTSSAAGAVPDSAAAGRGSGGVDRNSPDLESGPTPSSLGLATVPAYDRDALRAALPAIAARAAASPAAGVMADAARRTACAGSIPATSGDLRSVQRIRYGGRPAYVFVYADGDRLTGYVVTDACGSAAGLPATVLDTVS